ncbi:MAG: class I SAM-dependent methyltransferase [Patescibacteria group bacterium]|jgi:SAM-dependent methyltransferase
MTTKLLKILKSKLFRPGIIGLLINPFYLVRISIYKAIKKNAHELQGMTLDFGCGDKPYEHLFTVQKYVGIDVQQVGHDHESEPVDVYYDGKVIPFGNGYFDSCFSSQVFEHIFELENSLKEIHRVLKPDGTCLFIAPFVWDEHEVPFDFGRYSSFGLAYLLEKNGFQILKQEKDSHFAEVLAQLLCLYIYNILDTKNRYLNTLLCTIFIFPFTVLGLIIKYLAPRNSKLYFNNVFVVKKVLPS